MQHRTDPHPVPTARRPATRRGGFSFAEVLFAVIILAVGFILVAAIFPVAIQQTQSTAEDAAAAAAAREGANAITSLPTVVSNPGYPASAAAIAANPTLALPQFSLFPPTVKNYTLPSNYGPPPKSPFPVGVVPPPAIVVPFTGRRWDAVRASLVNPSDPRYAFVPFYRRENGASVAQLILIGVTSRNRPVFDSNLDVTLPSIYDGPVATTAQIIPKPQDPIQYKVCPDTVTVPSSPAWLGEGCYLRTDPNTGRSYRLGRYILSSSPPQFELDAADGLSAGAGPDGLWGTIDDIVNPMAVSGSVVAPATLQPVGAYAQIFSAAGSIGGRIRLSADLTHATGTAAANVAPIAAVPGTFVVVADDYPYDSATPTAVNYKVPPNRVAAVGPPQIFPLTVGALNGRVFRLGQAVPADASSTPVVQPGTFELDPLYPMPGPINGSNLLIPIDSGGTGPLARVYLVGAARTNAASTGDTTPGTTLTTYTGNAQDTGVFTTFFPVQ